MHRHNFPLGLAEVHPRIRGEYGTAAVGQGLRLGSPPHPRGILQNVNWIQVAGGFTPASAGNICRASQTHPK